MIVAVKGSVEPGRLLTNGCPAAESAFVQSTVRLQHILVHHNVRYQHGTCIRILCRAVCKGAADQSCEPVQLTCVENLIHTVSILLCRLICITARAEAVFVTYMFTEYVLLGIAVRNGQDLCVLIAACIGLVLVYLRITRTGIHKIIFQVLTPDLVVLISLQQEGNLTAYKLRPCFCGCIAICRQAFLVIAVCYGSGYFPSTNAAFAADIADTTAVVYFTFIAIATDTAYVIRTPNIVIAEAI